ncbi:MAG: alpha/beta hydrolase [Aeromicrobium sp.]|uniref:alpha/beta hydrolase n=1 Tax=Aeromicrobium sp. TaxID=1871063 RepID=UPI0039E63770
MSTTAPLPLRTRIFARALKVIARPVATGDEMIALRDKRARLLTSRVGSVVTGRDEPGVSVRDITVDLGGVTSRLRVHIPPGLDGLAPVVVNYHGGGWCIGSPEQSRWATSRVAARVGAVVVSPTYRLAPEHPFPAAPDDAWAVLRWVHEHAAEFGGDPERIAVMGDSAGGNLAAVAALQARDAGDLPVAAQVLVYPAVDAYEKWPSEAENADAPLLNAELMSTFIHLYLADGYGDQDWRHSPLKAASHADLPPALILTAGHDPIRDHGTHYAEALRATGVPVELREHPDAIHGFMSLPGAVPAATAGLTEIVSFLKQRFEV